MRLDAYDTLKASIIQTLLKVSGITNYVKKNIYPQYINSVSNPVYPCITVCHPSEETDRREIAENSEIKIDVWSKKGDDELHAIYNLIKSSINLKPPINGPAFYLRQTYMNDDLFEEKTQTWHLSAKYKVIHQ